MCVFAVRQSALGGITGDACKNEAPRIRKHFINNPRNVFLRTMLQHVCRNHTVELFLGQRAIRSVTRVVTAHFINVPVIQHTFKHARPGHLKTVRFVLHALAATVIEQRDGTGGNDQILDAFDVGKKTHPRIGFLGGKPQPLFAVAMQAAVLCGEFAVARTRVIAAV